MNTNAKREKIVAKRTGLWFAIALVLGVASAATAQDAQRPAISGVELSAGARGLILTLSATGPITLGAMPPDLETTTARYPELRVDIGGARSGLSASAIAGPEQLPVREISLSETANGVTLSVKMRGSVNGPVDVRSSANQIRILLTRDPQPEMKWVPSAAPAAVAGGARSEPVDMKKAEERAARDMQASGGEMFTVNRDGAQKSAPPPLPQTVPPPMPPKQQGAQAHPAAQTTAPATSPAPKIAPRTDTPSVDMESGEAVTEPPRAAELVRYRTQGRDPFVPLVKDTATTDLPRVENLRLVGVLEDYQERIALVEDFKNDNRAFALRANDVVEHGKVLRVQRDRVVFLIRDFDISRSYILTLSAP